MTLDDIQRRLDLYLALTKEEKDPALKRRHERFAAYYQMLKEERKNHVVNR